MRHYRLFIEKNESYDMHTHNIRKKIAHLCSPEFLKLWLVYDIFNVEEAELNTIKTSILADSQTDKVHIDIPSSSNHLFFAWEYLPGQYDQRGAAAEQCSQLLNISPRVRIRTGYLLFLSQDAQTHLDEIKRYLINPVDSREKALEQLLLDTPSTPTSISQIDGFDNYHTTELKQFIQQYKLSIHIEDILLFQQYCKERNKVPTLTEIKVIDTYWSDHCRHTTFLTHIKNITVKGDFKSSVCNALDEYYHLRKICKQEKKAISLMNLATIGAKYLKQKYILKHVEESEEINACSVEVDIQTAEGKQAWLLMFKNETHNHPTEIDPFGGASTCIGGAIRDPLSGRAFVFQGMRVSGAANPFLENLIPQKLSQVKIIKEAAYGFSSYGNQIGITTAHVREIFHEGYRAKRMEVGMVVGAVPKVYVRRETPLPGDAILLIGGKTGKDGIGGASGSSQTINSDNATADFVAEVQKGNAPMERKIQRLFRNKDFLCCVKKSNDFGAGGVSVAIGELAAGVCINLDAIPTKYEGLNGTELALSESQERMAIVCEQADVALIIALAKEENLEATLVAEVTEEKVLSMWWQEKEIVHLERSFLDSNGATRSVDVVCQTATYKDNVWEKSAKFTFANLEEKLSSLNQSHQGGLVNQFDYSIGKSTILAPLGGQTQMTEEDVGAQLLPHPTTTTASVIAFGLDIDMSSWSSFHGGVYAVVLSLAKLIASGVKLSKIYLSFQEYFARLEQQAEKWGQPFGALLGALVAQKELGIGAIGGKDSMSGTFGTLEVPPTLISFAIGTADIKDIVSSTLVSQNSYLYFLEIPLQEDYLPEWKSLHQAYNLFADLHQEGKILAAKSVSDGGIATALSKMSFGNMVGMEVTHPRLLYPYYGSIIFQSTDKIENEMLHLLGETNSSKKIVFDSDVAVDISSLLTINQKKLLSIYADFTQLPVQSLAPIEPYISDKNSKIFNIKTVSPTVCIPIFFGTNSEYDTAFSFEQAGFQQNTFVFIDQTTTDIIASINHFAKQIAKADVLALVGGFSYADEPDGAAKYISILLQNSQIAKAIQDLIQRGGLILGICNGFQALIKSGLLPFNQYKSIATLTHNATGKHISTLSQIKIISNLSPWIGKNEVKQIYQVPISHGEGRLRISENDYKQLVNQGQIVSQYVDRAGDPTLTYPYNPNSSDYAIEGITDATGQILGRMAHVERVKAGLYKNIPAVHYHNIFQNAKKYFT